jgi:hypothetical protein
LNLLVNNNLKRLKTLRMLLMHFAPKIVYVFGHHLDHPYVMSL